MASESNISLLLKTDIFLAPGSYFHPEYSNIHYHKLPPILKKIHNHRLIRQYPMPWPDRTTMILPNILLQEWSNLPKVALGLGTILYKEELPWWGKLTVYSDLRQQFANPLWQVSGVNIPSPQRLLALGAEQLFAQLIPFGAVYTDRLKHMFSYKTRQLIPSAVKAILPWNIIEETCHYVRKNAA
ncbi:hypothetical protein ABN056_12460 [Providencia vermicola]|uniref:Uncharacterized protein n=1 Tax=Providencia stuartii TaxID=588 RepID=A0AAI9I0Q3_PROST|nr:MULTISPECIES: hypothetical protein [Providencia]ELR5036291.1 hypothetical protein [Providencia stuartii]ELR5143827.1 hypothetical protein [Providencia stuartii]ELZ5940481.1 hypothetical protein [Providencia stuartii]MCK1145092.1 hypothetical protein [Providencia stuartii]WER22402.1 hypothetical protein P2E04_00625 [Providencia stuartii]